MFEEKKKKEEAHVMRTESIQRMRVMVKEIRKAMGSNCEAH